jgi:hypothetical protein
MHPLSEFFSESDKRFLAPEELKLLGRYALSLPHRLAIYRQIRDGELALLQPVADEMEKTLGKTGGETGGQAGRETGAIAIEQSLKQAIAILRASAMAMLTNDISSLDDTLRWVRQSQEHHCSQDTDALCFRLIVQQLEQQLEAPQFKLLLPFLEPFQRLSVVGV